MMDDVSEVANGRLCTTHVYYHHTCTCAGTLSVAPRMTWTRQCMLIGMMLTEALSL